jgi:hypothetical protein
MQCIAPERNFLKGVLLIVLSDNKIKDATSLSKKDKDKMLVMIEMDIQELKDRRMMY